MYGEMVMIGIKKVVSYLRNIKMKLTKKQIKELVEARLMLSYFKFYGTFPWIVRKIFDKYISKCYFKGNIDALRDLQWFQRKIKKIEETK
jgi:hypothetical protein